MSGKLWHLQEKRMITMQEWLPSRKVEKGENMDPREEKKKDLQQLIRYELFLRQEKSKRNKPMTMLVHKRAVKGKKSRSLIEKQRALRKHIDHVKKRSH